MNFIAMFVRMKVLAHKTSLAPPLVIEVSVTSKESGRSCICFFHRWNWPPRYHWTIAKRCVKYHDPNHIYMYVCSKWNTEKLWFKSPFLWNCLLIFVLYYLNCI